MRASLLEAHRDLFTAFERGDAAALAALSTADSHLYAPGQPDVIGRAALEDLGRRMFAQVRFSDLRTEAMELDIFGDTAYELTAYTQLDGRWRVHRNLYNWERPASG